MAMIRKYYSDWYEVYSRYPYGALAPGAALPPGTTGTFTFLNWLVSGSFRMFLRVSPSFESKDKQRACFHEQFR